MRIEIIARNYKLTDNLEEIINKKMEKFSRYFEDDAVAKIFLKETGKERYVMEVTIFFGNNMVRSEVASDNMYKNIDLALPKIEGQIRKHRTKLGKLKKSALEGDTMYPQQAEQSKMEVIRTKTMALKKIDLEEAVEDMELIDHDFYIFLNNGTGKVNVLYKRKAGNLGCIELDY
ncbi:MAG: ribosome-associated translation inhibitor RaiA [Clostridia bacterium]|nr:ribosome-associated translation inhibitor RaiA [Clostridia bacterium]